MLIAKQKREENISEYILYMWQLEDIIRAYSFDINVIDEHIIKPQRLPVHQSSEVKKWYQDMIDAMKAEGITTQGHLMHVKNIIQDLSELNIQQLQDPKNIGYKIAFNNAIPAIHDIIQKSNGLVRNEIDACFNALYGYLLLRMQKKEITGSTLQAVEFITIFIKALTKIFHQCEKDSSFS